MPPTKLQVVVGLTVPYMSLSPGLLQLLEILLGVGSTAGWGGYVVGAITGNMRCAVASTPIAPSWFAKHERTGQLGCLKCCPARSS
jgi:hypothetical protein